jgi:hypothetical protein
MTNRKHHEITCDVIPKDRCIVERIGDSWFIKVRRKDGAIRVETGIRATRADMEALRDFLIAELGGES